MKNNKGYFPMSNFSMLLLITFITGSSVTLSKGQENTAVAAIQHQTIKTVTYAIPSTANLSDLTDFDIATVRPFQENSSVTTSLLSDGSLKTENIYPDGVGGLDNWISKHYRTVFTKNRMVYYDQNNNVLFQQEANITDVLPTNSEFIANFGYSQPLTAPSSEDISTAVQSGMTVQTNADGSYELMKDNMTYILNPSKQTLETRFFKEGALEFSTLEKYTVLPNGKALLTYKVTKTYLPTYNNVIKLEKREEERYTNYMINGSPIAATAQRGSSITNEPKMQKGIEQYEPVNTSIAALTVSPNPTTGVLTVQYPTTGTLTIQILNLDGKLLKTQKGEGSIHVMDLSEFDKGIYLLRAESNGTVNYQKIVLQ